MPVSLDATVGGTNANSFITVAAANTIADNTLDVETWTGATADDKARALIMATTDLQPLAWVGTRATETQALAWPREDATINGRDIANNVIPREVQQATFDLAMSILAGAESATGSGDLVPGVPNSSLKRLKLDVMELEWREGGLPSNSASVYSKLVSRTPSLATVLYGTVTSGYTGGSGLLVGVARS